MRRIFLTLSILCVSPFATHGKCGDDLSSIYLEGIKLTSISNFVPSAYFLGESTKFISTEIDSLDDENICVDGNSAYSGPITLYDNGMNGDDIAGDGVFSRDCVHFCSSIVDLNDLYGFAMSHNVRSSRLSVVDSALRGKIPYESINTPLLPGLKVIASSHAFFVSDVNKIYYPKFPTSLEPNDGAAPSGKSVAVSALLQTFGDVFDYVTLTPLETRNTLQGAGIWKWQYWDRRGGPQPLRKFAGEVDKCQIAMSGVPIYRLSGLITCADTIDWFDAMIHEIEHGTCGYEFNNQLEAARTGDGMHVPGACTFDHSPLQGPVWDWVKGFPTSIPGSIHDDGVHLFHNDDCASCPSNSLPSCCSFRYEDVPKFKSEIMANPELYAFAPLLLYIAGMIPYNQIPKDKRTYYCMGSDTDGGCGDDGHDKPCVVKVNDDNRSKVTSEVVTRFTLNELIEANGGKRFPKKKFNVLRHAAVQLSARIPNEAEIAFFTMFWRHQEIETKPWDRTSLFSKHAIVPWNFATSGNSVLHSRLNGINCGSGSRWVPSCTNTEKFDVCKSAPCGPGAVCQNLNGQPLCICREGLVGDGYECAFPSETAYEGKPSAHEIGSNDDGKEECFAKDAQGNIWTNRKGEDFLPPYPGGKAPYSPTSCGNKVCPVGWRCLNNKCKPPSGKSMCVNKGFNKGKCLAIGCCKWKNGTCLKRNNICKKPVDPSKSSACTNKKTCCYFPCNKLDLAHDNTEIQHNENCGPHCTLGVTPDINGFTHWEFYLWSDGYYSGHEFYNFDDDSGPLNIQGPNKNMFDRCYQQCFVGKEDASQKYLFKVKSDDTLLLKTCDNLKKQKFHKRKLVCTSNAHNLSTQGYKPAKEMCPETCAPFM